MVRVVLLSAVVAWPGTVVAQTGAPVQTLTLDQAVHEALAANPTVRAARAGADAASAGVTAARAALFPRLSFSEQWQRGDQPIFVFSTLLASRRFAASNFAIDTLNHPDALGAFHATAAIEHLLFDGGARRASIAGERARVATANADVRETMHAIRASVVEIYGQLLSAQAMSRASLAALDAGREDLARATRRRDAGLATDADVLALAVHVADMEQRVIQATGDAAIARAHLNRMTGASIERVVDAVEPADPPEMTTLDMQALFAEASANRPEIARAAAMQDAADSARRVARSAFVPTIAAQAAVDVAGTRIADRASSWLIGGEVRWALSVGGAERAGLKAATASLVRARADADDVRARVEVEVVTAVERLKAARARQAVGREAVAQARESQRIVRDRYDAGLAPVNDVLRAATAVLDADTQRISALVDAITAHAQLNRAVGREE
ncbi:MAG: TolC family protein [Vicinamibacterales bacterium]